MSKQEIDRIDKEVRALAEKIVAKHPRNMRAISIKRAAAEILRKHKDDHRVCELRQYLRENDVKVKEINIK